MPFQSSSLLATQSSSWNDSWNTNNPETDTRYMLLDEYSVSINQKMNDDKDPLLLMKIYNQELENRKQDILNDEVKIKVIDDPCDETINDINFLQNIIKIKYKISQMTEKYKILQNEIKDNDTIPINDKLEIQNTIQSLLNKIASYRMIIKDTEHKDDIFESMCSICQTDSITHCIIPCGHTYCNTCTKRVIANKNCYICRKQIKDKIKLYIV
jgi:hypothetical protein